MPKSNTLKSKQLQLYVATRYSHFRKICRESGKFVYNPASLAKYEVNDNRQTKKTGLPDMDNPVLI
jgi:hypothetical protein